MFTTGDTQSARSRAHASGHRGDIVTTRGILIHGQTPNLFIPGEISSGPFNHYSGEKIHELVSSDIANKMYPGQFRDGNLSTSSLSLTFKLQWELDSSPSSVSEWQSTTLLLYLSANSIMGNVPGFSLAVKTRSLGF